MASTGLFVYSTHLSLLCFIFFFLMIRRPPRSTLDRSSAASDVYKRQAHALQIETLCQTRLIDRKEKPAQLIGTKLVKHLAVSYTHLRAHETVLDLVCRLLLEKTK